MGTWQGERAEKKIIKFADSLSVNAAAELLLWMSRSAAKNHHCVPKKKNQRDALAKSNVLLNKILYQ